MEWGNFFGKLLSPEAAWASAQGKDPIGMARQAGQGTGEPGTDPNFAQNALAGLTRSEWDRYLQDYVPEENRLIKYGMDPNAAEDASYLAGRNVQQSFGRQEEATGRRLRGLGLALNSDEAGAAQKATGLAQSLAQVGAMNNARDATVQRQRSVIGSPSPAVPRIN